MCPPLPLIRGNHKYPHEILSAITKLAKDMWIRFFAKNPTDFLGLALPDNCRPLGRGDFGRLPDRVLSGKLGVRGLWGEMGARRSSSERGRGGD